jgi:hypothetical protein
MIATAHLEENEIAVALNEIVDASQTICRDPSIFE